MSSEKDLVFFIISFFLKPWPYVWKCIDLIKPFFICKKADNWPIFHFQVALSRLCQIVRKPLSIWEPKTPMIPPWKKTTRWCHRYSHLIRYQLQGLIVEVGFSQFSVTLFETSCHPSKSIVNTLTKLIRVYFCLELVNQRYVCINWNLKIKIILVEINVDIVLILDYLNYILYSPG